MRSKIGLGALGIKIGVKIGGALIKLVKSMKIGKLGLAGASAASYAYVSTWEFALIIMLMLFVHESGHIWAMKRCGVRTKGIYFIPFVGGAAVADEEFPSRGAEVFIAIMGPLWGLSLVLVTGVVYALTHNPFFAAAAGWMAMVNLFNLLPVNPLDGGRIAKSIAYSTSSRLGFVFLAFGVILCMVLAFTFGFKLFFILLPVGALELISEYKRRIPYPSMNLAGTLASAAAYIVVAAALWGIMFSMSHVPDASIAMDFLKG